MRVKVVADDDYLPELLTLLGKAKSSIDILSFSFPIGSSKGKHNPKSSPFEIAAKLVEVKKKLGRKLRIRFFTEGLRETVDRNKVTADYLEGHGVEVKYGSTHAKGFIIDQRIVYFGSTNLTHQSLTKNHEANLIIQDKTVASQFMSYFEHLWSGGHHGELKLGGPVLADGEFYPELINLIDKAKKRIDFSIYFFNQRGIENALIRAHERGVKVRGFVHQHASFALPYIWANRSTVKRMKEKGIDDITWGPAFTFSHAKYIVADGKDLMLGTGNWLNEDINTHPQIYVRLHHVETAKELMKHLTYEIREAKKKAAQKAA